MKKILGLLALLFVTPVMAADNAVIITPGVGVTTRSKDIGALVQLPGVFLSDQTGAFPGAFANYGTSPGAVLVPGVNAFITNTPAVTGSGNFATTGAASAFADGWDITEGTKADAVCASATANTCSVIAMLKFIANGVIGPVATQANTVSIGAVGLTAPTTGGCTGQVIHSSATAIFTQVKASGGTLCWIRGANTGTNVYSVRTYDTATNGNVVCSSASNVLSNDAFQSNATSPGMVDNLGPYGQAHASGIGICITGALNSDTDVTSATTGLNLNIGFK